MPSLGLGHAMIRGMPGDEYGAQHVENRRLANQNRNKLRQIGSRSVRKINLNDSNISAIPNSLPNASQSGRMWLVNMNRWWLCTKLQKAPQSIGSLGSVGDDVLAGLCKTTPDFYSQWRLK